MMLRSFPNGYAPYDNEEIDICRIPLYKYVKDYMDNANNNQNGSVEQVNTNPTADVETEVDDLLNQLN